MGRSETSQPQSAAGRTRAWLRWRHVDGLPAWRWERLLHHSNISQVGISMVLGLRVTPICAKRNDNDDKCQAGHTKRKDQPPPLSTALLYVQPSWKLNQLNRHGKGASPWAKYKSWTRTKYKSWIYKQKVFLYQTKKSAPNLESVTVKGNCHSSTVLIILRCQTLYKDTLNVVT